MRVALRYVGRKPRGQRNLVHPVERRPYQFFADRALPATPVDETWAKELVAMKDKEGRALFIAEPLVAETVNVRCKRCDAEFSNKGFLLAHLRKEHKRK